VTVVDGQGTEGHEPWTLQPQPAGIWYIEVEPFKPGTAGRYSLRIAETITTEQFAERQAKLRYRSARMLQLWYEYRKDGAAAIERLAQEMRGHSPLVEPVPDDPRGDVIITFLWQGEAELVELLGGPGPQSVLTPMLRFEDTQLWYFSTRVRKDLRVAYAFQLGLPDLDAREAEPNFVTDPWNPSPPMSLSLVELPDAPAQPWVEPKPDVGKGRLVEATIESRSLAEPRRLAVYQPSNFSPNGPRLPFVVIFDGEAYGMDSGPASAQPALIPTPTILDNLIAAGEVPPMLAVFVASGQTRDRDLAMSGPFCEFLVEELLPWVRAEHHASSSASDAALAGSSLGGLTAAYCAFHHPQAFGNVLSQSGAFWYAPHEQASARFELEPGAFIREVIAGPRVPVKLWMEVGMYELGGGPLLGANLLAQNRHLRDVLILEGYDVNYHEYAGGHDYATWRGSLADGLIALFGARTSGPEPATGAHGG
jgi:enterochelin esterase-like enzyme